MNQSFQHEMFIWINHISKRLSFESTKSILNDIPRDLEASCSLLAVKRRSLVRKLELLARGTNTFW